MILLRFGELTLKGKNRNVFENRVMSHISETLAPYPRIKFTKAFGRCYLELNGEPYEDVAEKLKTVFGLVSFSPVRKAPLDLQAIREAALSEMRRLPQPPRTFKVSARRADKTFPYSSMELNHLIGGYLLKHTPGLKVDVHQPEVELHAEVRQEGAFVYCETIPGLGGYPRGSNGKAMLMLSGGIDSPVAGWLAMRKGLLLEAVHFHSFPYTSERAQQKVIDLTRKLAIYGGSIKLHMVPFTDIQVKLNEHKMKHLLITLMRRAMFAITEKLALKHDAGGIVTGESLGQVASQTLASLHVIGREVRLPVLRPLIAMDKSEIIKIAEKIDTYATSILPYEDCCTLFVPKSPSTKPNLRITETIERRLLWLPDMLNLAVERTETLTIGGNETDFRKNEQLF